MSPTPCGTWKEGAHAGKSSYPSDERRHGPVRAGAARRLGARRRRTRTPVAVRPGSTSGTRAGAGGAGPRRDVQQRPDRGFTGKLVLDRTNHRAVIVLSNSAAVSTPAADMVLVGENAWTPFALVLFF